MEATANRMHPLLTAAAVSVIALSVVGVAAMTGLLPSSVGSTREAAPVPSVTTAAPAAAPVAAAAEAPVAAPAPAPVAKPKPVKKVAARVPTPAPAEPVVPAQAPQPPLAQSQPPLAQLPPPPPAAVVPPRCMDCGSIENVREVEQKGQGSWIGPVAGGVGGAILGKQMGKGAGNTIMTVLGAAGGAYAGHEIEKRVRSTKHWDVSVRLEDGSLRTVSYDTLPAWRIGERVRYANGTIVPAQGS